MSDGDAPEHGSNGQFRRELIKTTAALGGFSLASTTAQAAAANEKTDPPKPYPNAGAATAGAVYFKHAAELDAAKRALGRYQSTGDASQLFSHTLRDRLDANPSQETFDVVVTTMGERTSMYRDDRRGQRLYGFSPTPAEVRSLSAFGDVTYVADLVSTKVCIRNVARDELRRLARRPSVVELSVMSGPIEPNKLGTDSDPAPVDASEIPTDSWTSFNSAHGNYTAYTISIGVIGAGYDTSYQPYSSNHANDIGFDISLSKDFTDESDPFNATTWDGHTTEVADTAAYMLKDGDTHSDQFVSLKITSDSERYIDGDETVRKTVEHATKNGIDVLNMSFGAKSYDNCPSHYCSELNSYTTGGGVPVAAVDNSDHTSKAEYPACSWHTVGVGGVNRKDTSGNAVTVKDTEFGEIEFNRRDYPAFCSWCYEESGRRRGFTPEVYSVSVIDTSNYSDPLNGTSFACPQVAASAWIDFADGGIGSYSDALDRFGNMDSTAVVSADDSRDPSREGNLLSADNYF